MAMMNKNLQLSIEQFIYFELYSSHIVSILGSSNKESKKKRIRSLPDPLNVSQKVNQSGSLLVLLNYHTRSRHVRNVTY
jgi:hypothetical protein